MMAERYDCTECKESLFGLKYILKEEKPYCIKCYETLFSSSCEVCQKPISCTSRDLSYKDRHWHSECFLCAKCSRSLVERPFATKDELLMCTDCYSNEYSAKCHACLKTIMPGSKKMEHKGNSWHENCFSCNRCQQPIGTRSFVQKEGHNYCLPCYEKQYALQCAYCKKVWVAVSTSRLSSASGTMTASTVKSAACPWWGGASSPVKRTSFALTVRRTCEETHLTYACTTNMFHHI
uniref:Four and a half LIM domains 2 n=1 Tax=Neogobius melanostomus TaxID=47308 RepID=A0A8C6U8T3_9GOBI